MPHHTPIPRHNAKVRCTDATCLHSIQPRLETRELSGIHFEPCDETCRVNGVKQFEDALKRMRQA